MKLVKTVDSSFTVNKQAHCQCNLDRETQGHLVARTAGADLKLGLLVFLGWWRKLFKEIMNTGPSQDLIKPLLGLLKVAFSPWNIVYLLEKKKKNLLQACYLLFLNFSEDQ